jgi:IMP dehydrogenase
VAETDKPVGAAVGVSGEFKQRAASLYDAGARVLCIDVAHGHHSNVERTIKTLKDTLGDSVTLIAGNVATAEGYYDLSLWGADAVRVGIGGGSICSTRTQTGHGVPTFWSVLGCAMERSAILKDDRRDDYKIKPAAIIADGGIKNSGDIVKALAAGSDFVILGSMLAGTTESPGALMQTTNGKSYKTYRGMASREAQEDWRGHASSLEGVATTVPYKGPVDLILRDLTQNIRSGLSYTGVKNIMDLQLNKEFIIQTSAAQIESSTHIMNRGHE